MVLSVFGNASVGHALYHAWPLLLSIFPSCPLLDSLPLVLYFLLHDSYALFTFCHFVSVHSSFPFCQTYCLGNLLVTKDCRLRIADFSLARERPTGRGIDPDEEIDGNYAH